MLQLQKAIAWNCMLDIKPFISCYLTVAYFQWHIPKYIFCFNKKNALFKHSTTWTTDLPFEGIFENKKEQDMAPIISVMSVIGLVWTSCTILDLEY